MANVSDLVGTLLQRNLAPSGQQRIGAALGQLQRAGLGALTGAGTAAGTAPGGQAAAGAGAPPAGGAAALLGGLLGALQGGTAAPGPGSANQAGAAPAGAADLLGGLLGALQSGATAANPATHQAPTQTGAAGLLGGLLGSLQGGQAAPQTGSGQGAGGMLGTLAGALLGGSRPAAGAGAAGGGAMALLAMLAMQALQGATQAGLAAPAAGFGGNLGAAGPWSGGEVPVGLRGANDPTEAAALELTSELVLEAMLNAAKADGVVTPDELQRIGGQLGETGANPALQQWLQQQLAAPLDVQAFAAKVPCPEVAAQVYAASLLAIEIDSDAEREYLHDLAQATGLHPLVVAQLHQNLGVQP